ncbi:ORF V: Enzymatic polyprotein [Labeo rohita]|uniref:ribonuclease H n=1 Tax=Labeo rohita TaxID=84645 RepID=A0ABQ8LBG3_LABRO|nr:ORF V: Enzymatic polyprotein [Labeo rohita]
MSMATLRSRLLFARRLPSSSSRGSSSGQKGFTAATARRLGDLQVTVQNAPPGKTPRASAPPHGPVVMPKQTAPPSKSGPNVSFGAPPEEELSISASEGERSADEAGASAERCPSAVAAPSEADAELSAMLLRAAKEIGLEVPKLVGAWRAPYSARSRPTSSALATLDGGAARGYEGVPQVERAVAVHLCPQDAATWRGSPRLPSKACRLLSALTDRAYSAAGQAATALHAMATLQVYQAKALKELHKGSPDQAVMQELRAVTDFALRATKVTARSLGTPPIAEPGADGRCRQSTLSKTLSRTLPSSSLRPPRSSRPLLRGQQPRPAALHGAPDTGSPEMVEAALRGMRTSVPPLPEEGRDLLCVQPRSAVPTHSQKEQFSTSLGQVPRDLFLSDNMSPRVRTRSQHSPAREPGKKVSAAQCGQTALQDVHPSGTSPLPLPAGCPTAVTSVNAPLIPLATRLAAWLELPSPSRWLIRTVRLGYAIQFARRPPKFRGVLFTSVCSDADASVLRAEIAVLLAKDAIEPVPPAEMKSGFYSPYFIVPKKSGGLRPILDLRVLNRSLLRLPFKMLTAKRILSCVRHQDWFAAIDLKDAYFHVSILPRHRPFLRFAFEGRAYQYKVLPFGLSLSPRVFTKVAEGALNPLWRKGIRILNYLDDWLIMAHSRDQLCEHRDLVLQHLSHLGLRVNREKSKLSPVQRISFLGMELDSVNMTACLTNERTQSVLNCLKSFRHKTAVPLKTFQRLLGHMAAAAAVTPLGLLHMRPLQRWLHDRVPRWAWHRGTLRIGVSPQCRRLFSPWSDPAFLRAGVPLGQVSRHVVVHTDASTTGWGAVCNGQAASGSWTGPRLLWHINCLELLAVLLALRCFLPMLRHKHVLVRTDNTATVAYINRQGGLRSRRMSQLARHLLLWSQTRLKSLRAVHIPGELNRAADQLSRQPTHPGEWRLHPQTVQLIWSRFGEAQIDLFASPESSHCQLYYSLTEAPLGRDALAHSWPPGPKYAFPPVSLLAQTLCKIREDGEQVLLVAPYWPTRTCPSLEDPLEEGPSFSGDGHNLAPASRSMEPARVASGRDTVDLSGLPQAVIETITQSRAPSTRQAYALRWGLFVDWCASRGEDPQRCPIAVVLSFLQEKLERRLSPSTLKVYVAAIAAYHDAVDGASIGKHQLVVRFLRGARRVNPPRPHLVPSWDLSVALRGLRGPPFEPLVSVELKFLSLKTALLTALASIKRVGDLQAFSVNEACLEFGPADSHVVLRPRPGYVPKVPTTPFRDQVVNLQALPPEEADPALALLCPVRALRVYVFMGLCTRSFRRSEQLFVCFRGQQKGNAVSKQRLAHWVVDAISLAYESQGEPCPLGVRAHSTRSVASSYALALAHGALLADICRHLQSCGLGDT